MGLPCSWTSISSTHLLLSPNIYVMLPVPGTYSLLVFLNFTILYIFFKVLDLTGLFASQVFPVSFPWSLMIFIQHLFRSAFLPSDYLHFTCAVMISSKAVVRLNSLGVVISATYVLSSLPL